jgi:aryl-alcohol dehydrogenase-like predicted oxidoreductase
MAIPTRTLGAGGPTVGAIGLGCMGMTWAYSAAERDDEESIAVIHRALELGVTLLDTADVYGPYTNEELVGRALNGRREQAVLATKVGYVVDEMPPNLRMSRDGRPEHVREGIDASLKRLNTDHVDLYQLHRVDENVPVEETWGAMAEVVRQGKAERIGLSEATVEQLEKAHAIHPVASLQSEFSLWTREPLGDVIPWCAEHGAAFIPFAPLGRGFLTGRLTGDFDDNDFRARNPRFSSEAMDANQAIVDKVRQVAERHEATPGQVALAWVLAQGEHIVPIPGTKRLRYLEENAAAANLTLTEDDLADLDEAPAPVGARY